MSKGDGQKRPYPGVGVTSKLLLYFLVFMMLMLLVVWVFQVMLLNVFYRNTKMNEMERIADMIAQSVQASITLSESPCPSLPITKQSPLESSSSPIIRASRRSAVA